MKRYDYQVDRDCRDGEVALYDRKPGQKRVKMATCVDRDAAEKIVVALNAAERPS